MAAKQKFCDTCKAIEKAIFSEHDFPVCLGRATDLRHRASYCVSCNKICEFMNIIGHSFWESENALLMLNRTERSSSEFYVELSTDRSVSSSAALRLLHENTPGVLVHSHFIDVNQIRRWLRHCDEQHAGNCHHLSSWKTIAPPESLLLIDVCWGCLVEMPGTIRYCALSYIWGQLPNSLETRQENIELLKQNGSITSEKNNSLIPKTVRDAIRLVQSLGQRYLWVDRLCIVQNDNENKHLNIMRMDSIYSNSYLTIVAADGLDANYWLPGLVDGLRPRSGTQCMVNFRRGTLISELLCRGDRQKDEIGRVYQRGWTFQELYLSRRTVVFSEESLTWQCQVSLWKDDIRGIPEGIEYLHDEPWRVLPFIHWPDIRMWAELVREYNVTDLTFPGDAQAAFSGIENVLRRSFPSGIFCGLPEFYFDWALLWQSNGHVERRTAKNNLTGHIFPSWSWLGWKGDIMLQYCHYLCSEYWKDSSAPDWKQESCSYELEPLVNWIQVGSSPSEERKIQSNWHSSEKWTEDNEKTTRNWTLKRVGGENWYANKSADGVLFRHPFPWTQQLLLGEEQIKWPPYLRLRSSASIFTITKFCQLILSSGTSTHKNIKNKFIISDSRGQVAGTLCLDRTPENQTPIGRECELLAISRGKVTLSDPVYGNVFPELYEDKFRKVEDVMEFYNVLYIEWEDSHMVREGLGRVEKSIWEQQGLREVDAELH
jgi:hypothetical protein